MSDEKTVVKSSELVMRYVYDFYTCSINYILVKLETRIYPSFPDHDLPWYYLLTGLCPVITQEYVAETYEACRENTLDSKRNLINIFLKDYDKASEDDRNTIRTSIDYQLEQYVAVCNLPEHIED